MYVVYMKTLGEEYLDPSVYRFAFDMDIDGQPIHDSERKLLAGSVVQGINTIDSFSFTMPPTHNAFNSVRDFVTVVRVLNTRTGKYEFDGRVLYSKQSMNDKGSIVREVVCESAVGFLCDSIYQSPIEITVTVDLFLQLLQTQHRAQVEPYKRFEYVIEDEALAATEVTLKADTKSTWETLKETLLDSGLAEFEASIEYNDLVYHFYPAGGRGVAGDTEIVLGKNMKTLSREVDPTAYITRLIPLGTASGTSTDGAIGIESVNGGVKWVDDPNGGVQTFGVHVDYKVFEGVTSPTEIMHEGLKWLDKQRLKVKNTLTVLDLSLLGLDPSAFYVANTYPVKHKLLDIDDRTRVTKKTINICDETKATLEFGEATKRLSDLQKEQATELSKITAKVNYIARDYVTNEKLEHDVEELHSTILQDFDNIYLGVSAFDKYKAETKAELELKVGKDASGNLKSALHAGANLLSITSDHFKLSKNGDIWANNLDLEGNISMDGNITMGGSIKMLGGITGELEEGQYAIKSGYQLDGGIFKMKKVVTTGTTALTQTFRVNNRPGNGVLLQCSSSDTFDANGMMIRSAGGALIGTWTLNSLEISTSDRNAKHDIETLPTPYGSVFDKLRPVRYKYNDGTSDRYHTGFIAQEVEEAILDAGLTTQDAAVFAREVKPDGSTSCGLRYGEFIALLVAEVQQLKARVAELEAKEAKA